MSESGLFTYSRYIDKYIANIFESDQPLLIKVKEKFWRIK
jgi:hypothetical protein